MQGLASWLAIAAIATALVREPHAPTGKGDKLLTFSDTVLTRALRPDNNYLQWVTGLDDGDSVDTNDGGDIVRTNVFTNKSTVMVEASKLPANTTLSLFSNSLETVVMVRQTTYLWARPSIKGAYVVDVASGKTEPLVADDEQATFSNIVVSPNGETVAYVRDNNIFIRNASGAVKQITHDGSPYVSNGVCVLSCVFVDSLLFSPDGTHLTFYKEVLSELLNYTMPLYNQDASGSPPKIAPQYPDITFLPYLKAGTPRGKVLVGVVNLETSKVSLTQVEEADGVEVATGLSWMTEDSATVVHEVMNRGQDKRNVVSIDRASMAKTVIHREETPGGWMNPSSSRFKSLYMGPLRNSTRRYFVDYGDSSGWRHIFLQSTDGKDRMQLTSGQWDVIDVVGVDGRAGLVYFLAAKEHSTESHIYSVSAVDRKIKLLVDEGSASWTGDLLPSKKHFLANYGGPNVPFQAVYAVGETEPAAVITSNAELVKKLEAYNLPNVTWLEMAHPDGFTLNVKRILPPNFDPSKKYPVLFAPYGGPESGEASKNFAGGYDWAMYIASDPKLNFIVYSVDGRGTANKGAKFRHAITRQLGKLEAQDQIWAAKEIQAKYAYVDKNHFGIWGWSFGGFLTSKVVEADSGAFTFAMITAPVTDWRFYFTSYTERYMKLPQDNPEGYANAAVRKADGFKNIKGSVSLTYGSGDGNVHPQHSKVMIDMLVSSGVTPSKFKMFEFTDSDHGIRYHGATSFHYRFLTERLWDELQRKDGEDDLEWRQSQQVSIEKSTINPPNAVLNTLLRDFTI